MHPIVDIDHIAAAFLALDRAQPGRPVVAVLADPGCDTHVPIGADDHATLHAVETVEGVGEQRDGVWHWCKTCDEGSWPSTATPAPAGGKAPFAESAIAGPDNPAGVIAVAVDIDDAPSPALRALQLIGSLPTDADIVAYAHDFAADPNEDPVDFLREGGPGA